jgi:DNA-binding CsgD family transcriptional regulator
MSQQENRISDSPFSKWVEGSTPLDENLEMARLSAARARAMDEAGAAIARQLNGPLTALLLYMGEIKQHSHQFSQSAGDRVYLQQVVENALQQTERVCAMMKQLADRDEGSAVGPGRKPGWKTRAAQATEATDATQAPSVMFSSGAGQKPLTRREREVLNLISEGYSNKLGALRMRISPRTFESHRAEAMRKLGARNTADLVRKALQHQGAV